MHESCPQQLGIRTARMKEDNKVKKRRVEEKYVGRENDPTT